MLVSVTGGTGFVGAHSVAALRQAGHQVRLLVRNRSTVDHALAPLGVDAGEVDVVDGDVLDEVAVARLVRGAGAVLHAASVYSFDSRRHAEMRAVNVAGTESVLDAARREGVGRVVYVSSFGALLPSSGARPVDVDSPVGRPREAYLASKAGAEVVARRHQEDGAPVVITYPPALLGPHDPKLGDQNTRLRNTLRGLMPIWPTGGLPVGDVRDTAALHASLVGAEPADDRYFGPGHYLTTREYVRTLRAATGRALPTVYLPARAMLPLGGLTTLVQRMWPWHIPAEYGAIYTCVHAVPVAERAGTFGIAARPVAETFADTVRWLHGAGYLSARAAGPALARPAYTS